MLQHAVFMEYLPAFLDAACVFCEFFSISTGKFYQKNTFMLKNNFFEQVCTEKFGSNSEYLRKYFYYKLLFGFSKLKNVWVTQNQQIRGENWVRLAIGLSSWLFSKRQPDESCRHFHVLRRF